MATTFKTIPVGTRVTWRYRSGTGHGTIKGVRKMGTNPGNTEYSIQVDAADLKAHKGEPSIRYHYGSDITVVSDHARKASTMATDAPPSDPLVESIYKKLIAKGMSPKAARAFATTAAKRERNAKKKAPPATPVSMGGVSVQFYDMRGNPTSPVDLAKTKGHHVGFDKLVTQLQAKGHSKASAERIAHYIGVRKYGAKGFGKLVKAGRK